MSSGRSVLLSFTCSPLRCSLLVANTLLATRYIGRMRTFVMRWSQYFIVTLREVPADADVISQKLMMRGGMIRKVAAGIYTYLPLGLRSVQKLEAIVREEMTRAGSTDGVPWIGQPALLQRETAATDALGQP